MSSTYLQIIQTACDELGLNRPSAVINSTDLQIRQLSALVKRDLRELQQNYDWTALQKEFDLTVEPPFSTFGDVSNNGSAILNVPLNVALGDFNNDFSADFGGGGGGPASVLLSNPQLFVVTGSNIVSNTRVLTAFQTSPTSAFVTISQPATGTALQTPIQFLQDTYPGPKDFDRYINQTWWDRTNHWALLGPDSPQIDQWHRSGIVATGPRRHWRQIGYNGETLAQGPLNNWRIWPPPGATDTPLQLVYEYISTNCVLSATGVPQATFLADTDFPILDENMMVLGAKWRMWAIKGFDYASMQAEWQDYVDRKYGNDGGAKTLSLTQRRSNFLLTSGSAPDGNWSSTPGGN